MCRINCTSSVSRISVRLPCEETMRPWERHAGFAFVVAAWIALAWIGWQVYSPPAPGPADIPESEISAERARVILKALVGRGIPNPTGSQENTLVRERIVNDLRSVGYDPQVQETHDSTALRVCQPAGGAEYRCPPPRPAATRAINAPEFGTASTSVATRERACSRSSHSSASEPIRARVGPTCGSSRP